MEWQDRSAHREWGGNVWDWYAMYSSWISEATDVLKPSQHIPPLPAPYHLTHYQAFRPGNPQKACITTNSQQTHIHNKLLVHVQSWATFKSLSVVFPTRLVCYPPSTAHPLVDIFSTMCLQWRLCESCLKSTSDFVNVTTLWCAHCAPAPGNGLCYAHPQIPGASRAVRFPLKSIYSQYSAAFQTHRGCNGVFFKYSLLKEGEVVLHQKAAMLHARRHV